MTTDPSTDPHAHCHSDHAPTNTTTAKDPVCGMSVDPQTAKHRHDHDGQTYYFCCNGCRTKFAADPGKYLSAKAEAATGIRDARTTRSRTRSAA